MNTIHLLLVPAPGCHPPGTYQITEIPTQYANLGMYRSLVDDSNIKNSKRNKIDNVVIVSRSRYNFVAIYILCAVGI